MYPNFATKHVQHAPGYGGKPFSYQGKASFGPVAAGGSLEFHSSHLHQHSNHHQSYPFVDVSSLLSSGTNDGDDGHRRDTDYSFTGYYHNRYTPRFQQKLPSNTFLLSSVPGGDGKAADSPANSIGRNIQTYIASPIANEPINNQNRLLTTYLNSRPAMTAERSPSQLSAQPQQQKQQQQQLQQQQLQQQLQQQQLQRQQQTSGASVFGYSSQTTTEKYSSQTQWGYQVLPTLYSIYQKVPCTIVVPACYNTTTDTTLLLLPTTYYY